MRRTAVLLFVLLACSSSPALAATIQPALGGGPLVIYKAGWNETNDVRAWLSPTGHLIIRDNGAPLTAVDPQNTGVPCTQVGPHQVDCDTRTMLFAQLNNLDDRLSFDVFQPQYELTARGLAGEDWIRGGAGHDWIESESGLGRGGNDQLRAALTLADGGAGIDTCRPGPVATVIRCER